MSLALNKLIRFCLAGGTVAVADFGLIWLLIHVMGRLAAVALAYILAVTLHFCLNRWWVFAATQNPAGSQLPKYVLAVASCWLCTLAVTALSLATFTTNVFVAKAAAIPPATLLGFVLMRSFVFRHPSGAALAQCKD